MVSNASGLVTAAATIHRRRLAHWLTHCDAATTVRWKSLPSGFSMPERRACPSVRVRHRRSRLRRGRRRIGRLCTFRLRGACL